MRRSRRYQLRRRRGRVRARHKGAEEGEREQTLMMTGGIVVVPYLSQHDHDHWTGRSMTLNTVMTTTCCRCRRWSASQPASFVSVETPSPPWPHVSSDADPPRNEDDDDRGHRTTPLSSATVEGGKWEGEGRPPRRATFSPCMTARNDVTGGSGSGVNGHRPLWAARGEGGTRNRRPRPSPPHPPSAAGGKSRRRSSTSDTTGKSARAAGSMRPSRRPPSSHPRPPPGGGNAPLPLRGPRRRRRPRRGGGGRRRRGGYGRKSSSHMHPPSMTGGAGGRYGGETSISRGRAWSARKRGIRPTSGPHVHIETGAAP